MCWLRPAEQCLFYEADSPAPAPATSLAMPARAAGRMQPRRPTRMWPRIINVYIYIYVYTDRDMCIYIYIYIERERERHGDRCRPVRAGCSEAPGVALREASLACSEGHTPCRNACGEPDSRAATANNNMLIIVLMTRTVIIILIPIIIILTDNNTNGDDNDR